MATSIEPQNPGDAIALAGILGRIEANLGNVFGSVKELSAGMKEIDARLRVVETAVAQQPDEGRIRNLEATVEIIQTTIQATKPAPKTPWYSVIAGIAGVGAIVTAFVFIINLIVTHVPL